MITRFVTTATARRLRQKMVKIVLGTMEFGRDERETSTTEASHALVREFVAAGHQELDTAYMYAGGNSEKIIGLLPADLQSKVTVATKANPWSEPWKSLTPESVVAQQMQSFERLQTDAIDLFYLHAPDHNNDVEKTLACVNELYTSGKFKRFGLSNYSAAEVESIHRICTERGYMVPVVYQGMYNALTRQVEADLFPVLKRLGIAFYAFNPLAGGMLTGRYLPTSEEKSSRFFGNNWAERYRKRFWRQEVFDSVVEVTEALKKFNADLTMTDAALLWLVHHSQLSEGDAIIIGASRMAHVKANLAGVTKGRLNDEVVAAFDNGWKKCEADCPSYCR